MINPVKLETHRTHYSAGEAAKSSITVADLIEILEEYDPESKIIFSNDDGYTYGTISYDDVEDCE